MSGSSEKGEEFRAVQAWMDEFDPIREDAIDRLTDGNAVGEVDGVTIDFRHPALEEGAFRPAVDWWTRENSAELRGPWNVSDEEAAQVQMQAVAGDTVLVDRIESVPLPIRQDSDAPEDAFGVHAFLIIRSPGAPDQKLSKPLWFLRTDSLVEVDPDVAPQVLHQRLGRLISQAPEELPVGSYLALAATYSDFVEHLCVGRAESDAELIGASMLFGYALARAEIEANPAVVKSLRSRQGQKDGGRATGRLQAKDADKWRQPALALAIDIRGADPSLGQAKLAETIRKRWPNEHHLPGFEQIINTIKVWEKSGQLQRSSRNPALRTNGGGS